MKHLTQEQRYEISALLRAHHSKSEIAKIVGVHKSTITREIARNSYLGTKLYYAGYAQRQAESRVRMRSSNFKKPIPKYIFEYARKLIVEEQFSPEQVVGYCRRFGIKMCSHESLYKWIWKDKSYGGDVYKYLRRRGKKYKSRGSVNNSRSFIPDAVDISQRPFEVNTRERFGDFEIDTIVGANGKQHILTVVERKTGLLLMRKLKEPNAYETAQTLIDLLRPLAGLVKTITSDNAKQFVMHKWIAEATGSSFFFARPYRSWERGTNENTNGLIRQYIPKRTDFDTLTEQDIIEIQWKINNRPRKRFDYLSPIEKLQIETEIDAKVAFDA